MHKIGVLGLQGSVIEHETVITRIGHEAVNVRYADQIAGLDAIVLPGGESTTLGLLLHETGMFEPLRDAIAKGLPVYGTCAGMILLAQRIEGQDWAHLGLMDILVQRNAYGSQLDSFRTDAVIEPVSDKPIPLVFIRAPYIEECGPKAQSLCEVNGKIVAAHQDNMLVSSFHPELTGSDEFMEYFVRAFID